MVTVGATGSDLPGVPHNLAGSPKDRQPTNQNALNPTFFRFYLHRVPAVTYFCQSANIPGLSVDPIDQDTFFTNARHPSSKPSYEDLNLTFIVDEDMVNWREIYDWMNSFSNKDDFVQYVPNESDHFSDATLSILTSGINANLEVTFKNCFPISLGGVNFDSSVTDMDTITSDLTLAFDSYEIRKL